MRSAKRTGAEWFQRPGRPHEALTTVNVLDDRTVEDALQRVDGRNHFSVVEFEYFGANGDPQDDAG
jgi:hypothetical protein